MEFYTITVYNVQTVKYILTVIKLLKNVDEYISMDKNMCRS